MRVGIEHRETRTSLPWHDVVITTEWSEGDHLAVKKMRLRDIVLVERPLAQGIDGSILDTSLRLACLLDRPVNKVRCLYPDQALDFEDDLKRALRNLPGIEVRFDTTLTWDNRRRGRIAESLRKAGQIFRPIRATPIPDMPSFPAPRPGNYR